MMISDELRRSLLAFLCLSLVCVSETVQSNAGSAQERGCDEYRRQMTTLIQRAYENKAGPNFLKKFIPKWIEMSLPTNCYQQTNTISFPKDNNDGHLEPLGGSVDVASTRSNSRSKREFEGNYNLGISRSRREAHANEINYLDIPVLSREKRFLGAGSAVATPDFAAMSFGGPTLGGPQREVSESAQMMNNLLMISKFQKNNLAREYSTIGRQGTGYVSDRMNFGSGMYGDVYHGKKKREVTRFDASEATGMRSDGVLKSFSRKKRFLIAAEPAEGPFPPTLLSMYLGTAQDPNTGKRLEISGDIVKRAMGSTLMTFLPPGMQPPLGKDPADFAKQLEPLFLSNTASAGSYKKQNRNGLFGDSLPGRRKKRSTKSSETDITLLNISGGLDGPENKGETIQAPLSPSQPPITFLINTPSTLPQTITPPAASPSCINYLLTNPLVIFSRFLTSKLNRPYQQLPQTPSVISGRRKRASNSDVVTIGDVSIPLEFFKPQERSEDTKSESDYSRQQSPPPSHPRQIQRHSEQNINHIHQAYQTIIHRYKQALYDQKYQNQYIHKIPPLSNHIHTSINQSPSYEHRSQYSGTLPFPHLQPSPSAQHSTSHHSNIIQPPLTLSQPSQYFPQPPPYTIQHPQPLSQYQQPIIQHVQLPIQHPQYSTQQIPHTPIPNPPNKNLPPPLPVPPFTYQAPLPQAPPISHNSPPADPLWPLQPALPTRRVRRSNDNADKSKSNYFIDPSLLSSSFSSLYPPNLYVPPTHSTQSNKAGHRSPSGEIIYGDTPLWDRQTGSIFSSQPSALPLQYTPGNANNPTSSSYNSYGNEAYPRLSNSHINRSFRPNSPGSGVYNNAFPQIPPSAPIIYSPRNIPQPNPQHNKAGYSTGRGGVVYGDRLPWQGRDHYAPASRHTPPHAPAPHFQPRLFF